MAEVSAPVAVQIASPNKKAVKVKGAAKASHPKTADLVLQAVTMLNKKGGSSLQAIKKYLVQVHKIDLGRMRTFIIKAIKNLTTNGDLVRVTGRGASGSFKLPETRVVTVALPSASRSKLRVCFIKVSEVVERKFPVNQRPYIEKLINDGFDVAEKSNHDLSIKIIHTKAGRLEAKVEFSPYIQP